MKEVVIQGTSEVPGNGDSWQNDFEYGNSDNNNRFCVSILIIKLMII